MLIGIFCNWSRHCDACSCLETMQALEICHIKLVQAFALRIRSITYGKAVVNRGQDGGVDRTLERKRCSCRLDGFCESVKLCISDKVIASYSKPDAVFTTGLVLVALGHSRQYCMLKGFRPCPTHFHVAELAVAASQRGFMVRSLLAPCIETLLDRCGYDHRNSQVMSG
jgi:hypothetical protein